VGNLFLALRQCQPFSHQLRCSKSFWYVQIPDYSTHGRGHCDVVHSHTLQSASSVSNNSVLVSLHIMRDLCLPTAHDHIVPDSLRLFPHGCQHHCHAEPEVTTRRRLLLAGKALLLAATCPCCAQLAQAEEHGSFSYAGSDTGPSAWPGELCIARPFNKSS